MRARKLLPSLNPQPRLKRSRRPTRRRKQRRSSRPRRIKRQTKMLRLMIVPSSKSLAILTSRKRSMKKLRETLPLRK